MDRSEPGDGPWLFVAVRGPPCSPGTSQEQYFLQSARAQTTQALLPTLELLVRYHYACHGWSLDRTLTDADAQVKLDKELSVMSVYFDDHAFRTFVDFPILTKDAARQYVWGSRNVEVRSFKAVHPMNLDRRVAIFATMLAIEQHVQNLKEKLNVQ